MPKLRRSTPPEGGRPRRRHLPPDRTQARHLADALRRWTPTQALARAVLLVGLLLVGAMLLGRVDLVVLAAPFALGAALGIWRRPARVPAVRVATDAEFLTEGGELAAVLTVGNLDEVPYDL